ncbi:MAG: transglutaminase family protein [Chloroflexota bacterium]|nr:transglutaminase family protein [Chloroflexota bacterium]
MRPAPEGAVFDVRHLTVYRYAVPVRSCVMSLRLRPRQDRGQRVGEGLIETKPAGSIAAGCDAFGNHWHLLAVRSTHQKLEVLSRSRVRTAAQREDTSGAGRVGWGDYRTLAPDPDHWDFIGDSAFARSSPALASFADRNGLARPVAEPLADLAGLSAAIHREFVFAPGSTTASSTIEDMLASGRGVCQDYAHLMIALARSWGVPSRYVSGYLHIADHAGSPIRQTAMHAWVECLLPDGNWAGFDPANDCPVGGGYIRVAVGRDYGDAAPTAGVFEGGWESELTVEIDVIPALS